MVVLGIFWNFFYKKHGFLANAAPTYREWKQGENTSPKGPKKILFLLSSGSATNPHLPATPRKKIRLPFISNWLHRVRGDYKWLHKWQLMYSQSSLKWKQIGDPQTKHARTGQQHQAHRHFIPFLHNWYFLKNLVSNINHVDCSAAGYGLTRWFMSEWRMAARPASNTSNLTMDRISFVYGCLCVSVNLVFE